MHPRYDLVLAQPGYGSIDQLVRRQQITKPQFAVLEHLLDLFGRVAGPETQVAEGNALRLAIKAVPCLEHRTERRSSVAGGGLNEHIRKLSGKFQRLDEQCVEPETTRDAQIAVFSGHGNHHRLDGTLQTRGNGGTLPRRNVGSIGKSDACEKLCTEAAAGHAFRIEVRTIQARPVTRVALR